MMRALAIVVLAACGGKPATPPPTKPVAAPVALDPACPPAGELALPDGKLRCRELPFELAFPPSTKLVRTNDGTTTLFSAVLERGVIALVAEPRTDSPDDKRIADLVGNLVKGIAGDAVLAPADAPKLDGALASAAISFTTPDGGAGLARGYFANHWLFAVVVGGRLATTPTRPDTPLAKSFLGSLRVRALPKGTVPLALAGGAHVEIPATAWNTGPLPPEDGVRTEWLMLVPDRGVWIGVRELEPRDRCEFVKSAGDDLERLKSMYSNPEHPLERIEHAGYGELSIYAQTKAEGRNVALTFICAGKTVVQLSVLGDRPATELRPLLDELAKTLVGAK